MFVNYGISVIVAKGFPLSTTSSNIIARSKFFSIYPLNNNVFQDQGFFKIISDKYENIAASKNNNNNGCFSPTVDTPNERSIDHT